MQDKYSSNNLFKINQSMAIKMRRKFSMMFFLNNHLTTNRFVYFN